MSGPWFSDDELRLSSPPEGTVTIGGQVFKTNSFVVQATPEMLDDAAVMRDIFANAMDRALNPWRYPDRPAWPPFVLLPALERARSGAQVAAQRVRGAWAVLWGRETLSDNGDDW